MTNETIAQGRLREIESNRALLIGTYTVGRERMNTEVNLKELQSLAETYGLVVSEEMSCPLRKIDAGTYLGKGKVEEITKLLQKVQVDLVIFDDEISPQQQRNLEKIFSKPVIDRAELILGVFSQRAQTKEAKIQIGLAQLRYQLPRLRRMWTHLHRQRGGGGGGRGGGYLKGEGERQIEIDRRLIRSRISRLKEELVIVRKNRVIQRRARKRNKIPTFAIVGYTNAGKSTLLKTLTEAEVFIEDKLFATLDTTTRRFILPNQQRILLTDTVGFIRKIPTTLIAAFKSTLEEAMRADILIHVVDISENQAQDQIAATNHVLKELRAHKKPTIYVFNKMDQHKGTIERFKMTYAKACFISADKKIGLERLLELMQNELTQMQTTYSLKIPQSQYNFVSKLMKEASVLSCEYVENDILLEVQVPLHLESLANQFKC